MRDRRVSEPPRADHRLSVVSVPTVATVVPSALSPIPVMVPPRSARVVWGRLHTSIVPSDRPDTNCVASGLNWAEKVRTEPCSEAVCSAHRVMGVLGSAVFHTVTVPSARAEARAVPSRLKVIDQDPAVVFGSDELIGVGRAGSATFHSCALGLSPVTASDRLSGLNATAWVMLGNPVIGGPAGTGRSPVVHKCTTWSSPPLASRRPSGLKARVRAAALCPRSTAVCTGTPAVGTAKMVTVPSSDDAARVVPSTAKRTMYTVPRPGDIVATRRGEVAELMSHNRTRPSPLPAARIGRVGWKLTDVTYWPNPVITARC